MYIIRSSIFLLFVSFLFACDKDDSLNGPDANLNTGDPSVIPEFIQVIHDRFEEEDLVVVGSENYGFIVSFYPEAEDGTQLIFQAIQGKLPVAMKDQGGTSWDFFGHALEGPRKGEQLKSPNACMGYWFAFSSVFPGATIYDVGNVHVDRSYNTHENWLIPTEHVVFATGFDWISSLEFPEHVTVSPRVFAGEEFYVRENELVLGIKMGGKIRLYPHKVMDWHEIVNDSLGNRNFSMIYCPLTGTGTAWSRNINGSEMTFGVSGLLYNNNILPFDRNTRSIWSQLKQLCVSGDHKGLVPEMYPTVEMSWGTWKSVLQQPEVLSDQTGSGRNYNDYPYGDYRTNYDLVFYPMPYDDKRLPRKERVYGVVINDQVKVYRFSHFN